MYRINKFIGIVLVIISMLNVVVAFSQVKVKKGGKPPRGPLADQYIIMPNHIFCGEGVINAGCDYDSIEWDQNPSLHTPELEVTETGVHIAKVEYANGFYYYKKFNVIVNPKPMVNLGVDISLCNQEGYLLDAGIFNDYVWSKNDNELIDQFSNSIVVLENGNYHVVVTDDNGCQAEDDINITISAPINIDVQTTKTCSNTGTIELFVTGGVGPYKYLWSDDDSRISSTAENLEKGIYTIEVSDINDCSSFITVEVEEDVFCADIYQYHCDVEINNLNWKHTIERNVGLAEKYVYSFYELNDGLETGEEYSLEVDASQVHSTTGYKNYVLLSNVNGLKYNTDYYVTVAVKIGETIYSESKKECVLHVREPLADIYQYHCDVEINNLNWKHTIERNVGLAEKYVYSFYELNDGLETGEEYSLEVDASQVHSTTGYKNYVLLSNVNGLKYNTDYYVTVAVKIGETIYSESKKECVLHVREPLADIYQYHCNDGIMHDLDWKILSEKVDLADAYVFKFYQTDDASESNILQGLYDGPEQLYFGNPYVTLSQVVPSLNYNQTYDVTVSVEYDGVLYAESALGCAVMTGDIVSSQLNKMSFENISTLQKSSNKTSSNLSENIQEPIYQEESIDVIVYPNPSLIGQLSIYFTGGENISYTLTDIISNIVFENKRSSEKELVDTNGMAPGVYMINAVVDGQCISKKIVIK